MYSLESQFYLSSQNKLMVDKITIFFTPASVTSHKSQSCQTRQVYNSIHGYGPIEFISRIPSGLVLLIPNSSGARSHPCVCHPRFVNPIQTLADLSFVFMWGPKLMTSTFIHFRESGARLHPDALFADAKTRKSPPRQRTEAEASSTP